MKKNYYFIKFLSKIKKFIIIYDKFILINGIKVTISTFYLLLLKKKWKILLFIFYLKFFNEWIIQNSLIKFHYYEIFE